MSHCSQVRTWPAQKGARQLPHGQPLEASYLPSPVPPQGSALLLCDASLQSTWRSRNPISAYMMATLTSNSQFLVPGGVSCLSLSSLCSRGRLQEEKQTRKQIARQRHCGKVGHHPALPGGMPPPAPQLFPATSAWLPVRGELVDLEQKAGAPASGVGAGLDTRDPCRGCAARQGSAGQGSDRGRAQPQRLPVQSVCPPALRMLCFSFPFQ